MNRPTLPAPAAGRTAATGVACGAAAALFWAAGFVAARHAIAIGFSPSDVTIHRFVWAGLIFLPFLGARSGRALFGGLGLGRGALLTLFGGPPLALLSYAGFLFVPLAHGGVIQPSCAALGGMVLAAWVLNERFSSLRASGAAVIVAGLAVIAGEALTSMGMDELVGDLSFATAGLLFATFATLLRYWRITPMRAVAITSVLSLVIVPIHALAEGFGRMAALGLRENLSQLVAQGLLAGAAATYCFTRAVALLGAGRAAVFPSLVPCFTLLIGLLVRSEVPSPAQLAGLALVTTGFWLTQKP